MRFQVLSAHGEDKARWSSLVAALDPRMRDIHFLPEYGLVYERTYGDRAHLAFCGDGADFVIQPFLTRRLNELPFLKEQGISEPYYDIANPYGFGGPVCRCDGPRDSSGLFERFNEAFIAWCRQERIASEFASLHPLLQSHHLLMQSGITGLDLQKEVVYIDLTAGESTIWTGVRKGHRSSIQKARKSGVRVEKVEPRADTFAEFGRLYYQTMDRNKAAERWHFPKDYFRNCHEVLGDERVSLFFARVGGELAAAAILLHDFDTVYYHFSGSDERLYEYCANNLLVYEVALWGLGRDLRSFHLGGGVSASPNDKLLRFKAGFSRTVAPLYTYHRVHHEETYQRLCELKIEYEGRGGGIVGRQDFFPLYRR